MELSGRGRDWTGARLGHITVVRCVGQNERHQYVWECMCDCGRTCTKASVVLTRGVTYCGHRCAIKGKAIATHGKSHTKEYRAWVSMKARCYCTSHKNHAEYGGRGVIVHPDWNSDFNAFLTYVGMAPSDEHTIDRIDVDGDYCPGNVRWATHAEQNLNRRNTLRAEIAGEVLPLKTIAERYGAAYGAVLSRYKRGLRGHDLVKAHPVGRKPKQK
jgi:hypothetical protein